ncbi:hypothetical protein [Streptomyces sp. NPDC057286]|uniref:hypothetical protein n=1 Tax=Streptomyces sp. NPDC057286 TaxID=3346085 RepID=UPI00362BB453
MSTPTRTLKRHRRGKPDVRRGRPAVDGSLRRVAGRTFLGDGGSARDLGAADVSTLDIGRLLLISFATVFGNDCFLVPLEAPAASLTVLDRVLVRDVLGRHHLGGAAHGQSRTTISNRAERVGRLR